MDIDLHIHSNASLDGEVSVEEIIDMAIKKNLKYIAIADHESVDNVEKALAYAEGKDINIIKAAEIFVNHSGRLLHMLGYNIDIHNEALQEQINKIWESRNENVEIQFKKIKEAGLKIDREEVFEYGKSKNPLPSAFIYAILHKEENRNHPVVNGLPCNIDSIIKLSREHFAVGKDLYVESYMPSSKKLVGIINDAGGKAVIAHPGVDIKNDTYILDELISYGIKGIEAYYTSHTKEQNEMYKNYAIENNLFYTCGSDFHGSFKPKNSLGIVQTDNNEQAIKGIFK